MRYLLVPLRGKSGLRVLALCASLFAPASATARPSVNPHGVAQSADAITFAVIGDFGDSKNPAMKQVAQLIESWKPEPDFIITVGDNNYPCGGHRTFGATVGKYYSKYIYPYPASATGPKSPVNENRFFPTLGNHDWGTLCCMPPPPGSICTEISSAAFTDNFPAPIKNRYYNFRKGPVEFFALDSDCNEPDGITSTSKQAAWLEAQLSASTAPHKIVYFHNPPYSSGEHGSTANMQWPFKKWGATVVLTGHEHSYERLNVDSLPYFVNGVGGVALRPLCYTPAKKIRSPGPNGTLGAACNIVAGSILTYNEYNGALLVTADASGMTFKLINVRGKTVDGCKIGASSDSTLKPC